MWMHLLISGTILGLQVATPATPAGRSRRNGWKSVVYAVKGSIKVNGYLLYKIGRPREFSDLSLWRYDSDDKSWAKVDSRFEQPTILKPEDGEVYSYGPDREILRIQAEFGLFWAEWREDGHWSDRVMFVGPVRCIDVNIGKPPEGMVATCVPFADHARAMFVPDPKLHCRPTPAEMLRSPGLGKDLAALRAHDQAAFRASPQVLDAAQRVFAEVRLEGRASDDVVQLLGSPLEKGRIDGYETWIYSYHNGEAGVVRRLWFDRGKVSEVELIPTQ